MFFFVHRTFEIGGLKTLVLREVEWLRQKEDSVCVICEYMDSEMEQRLKHLGASQKIINDWKYNNVYSTVIKEQESNNDVIQFLGFEEFLCFQLKNKDCRFKAYLYCVNPIDFHLGQKNKLLRLFLIPLIRPVIKGYTKAKSIVYIDEMTLESNIRYYNMSIDECDWTFVPLPFYPRCKKNNALSDNTLRILAVARASFPFKGYLLGLIDTLDKHYDEIPNFKLTIISAGDDIKILKEKINTANEHIGNKIELIEGVRSDRLDEFYSSSNLFIGMGTTVLEAADSGTPTIVVTPYTDKFISDGFFHNNPSSLVSSISSIQDGWKELDKYIGCSAQERIEISKKTRKSLDYYDANFILTKLNSLVCASIYKINFIRMTFLKGYFYIKSRVLG